MQKALVIEDDPAIALLVSELIRMQGIEVNTFLNAKDCLLNLPKTAPLIVICDLLLPDLSAFELFENIVKNYHPKSPNLVLMSAKDQIDIPDSLSNIKILKKPFDLRVFSEFIKKINHAPC